MQPQEYILKAKEKYGSQRNKEGVLIRDMDDKELFKRLMERYPDDQNQIVGVEEYLGAENAPTVKPTSTVSERIGGVLKKIRETGRNIVDKTAESVNERGENFAEIDAAGKAGEQTKVETVAQKFGQGLGLAGDVAFNILSGLTPAGIKDPAKKAAMAALQTPLGQKAAEKLAEGIEAYEDWKAEDPSHARIARNIDAIINIGSIVPAGKGGQLGGKGAKKAAEIAAEQAGKAGKGLVEAGKEALEAAGKGAGKIIDKTADAGKVIAEKAAPIVEPATEIIGDTTRGLKKRVANTIENAKNDVEVKKTIKSKGKNAIDVYDESGSTEFINVIDNTLSKEDLQAKKKMLDIAEERLKGSASSKLPRAVIAEDYVVPKVDALRTRMEELGKQIGAPVKDNTEVDTSDIFDFLVEEAKRFDVNVGFDADGHLTFSRAPGVSGVDSARINAIKDLFDGFTPDPDTGKVTNTISQLAKTRKNLSALTKRTDAAKEIVGPGGAVDNARRKIAQKIGEDYFQATREYSDIARVLEQLDPDLKVRLSDDAIEEISNIKFADFARRLLSNNAAQAKSVFRSLDELYAKEATRQGIDVPVQDLEDLVDFAGAIEEGFGITPRNTFFGQTSGGVSEALMNNPLSPTQAVVNLFSKPKRDDKRALAAMRRYVEEVLSKKE